MASVLALVLATRDMYPEVFAIAVFSYTLIKVGVVDDPLHPLATKFLVGIGFVV